MYKSYKAEKIVSRKSKAWNEEETIRKGDKRNKTVRDRSQKRDYTFLEA